MKRYFTAIIALFLCVILSIYAFYRPDRSSLRDFPYPYHSMLALQSHIDGTTLDEFVEFHTYLNTHENTVYGDGLGLDIGDSFWMYDANDGVNYIATDNLQPSDYMTWFDGIDTDKLNDAAEIKKYWDMGWIDSIHSYGDFSRSDKQMLCSRSLAQNAWSALTEAGIKPTVWINHGTPTNVQNFGGYTPITSTSYQSGDNPRLPYYHTDLTRKNGLKYVWNSRNFSHFGTDNPLYLTKLRDGQTIWCFNAYTGYPTEEGYTYTWTPVMLGEILNESNLDMIVNERLYSIIATHFGSGDTWEMLGEHNLPALRLLKKYNSEKQVMVVRSSRLLEYAAIRSCLVYTIKDGIIDILRVDDPVSGSYIPAPDKLNGITFYCDKSAVVCINGEIVPEQWLKRNEADETGRESVMFRWYPQNITQ